LQKEKITKSAALRPSKAFFFFFSHITSTKEKKRKRRPALILPGCLPEFPASGIPAFSILYAQRPEFLQGLNKKVKPGILQLAK